MTLDLQQELGTALAHHQNGELDRATRIYQRLLKQEPHNPELLHLLGVAALQQGDAARAVELIGQAVAKKPSIPAFHSNLAEAYRALGQLERAVGCCRTALRLQADFVDAANNLGLALMDQGKTEQAIAAFENALRSRPDFAHALNNLGNAWRRQGDKVQAEDYFRRAVACDPLLAEAHSNLGQILVENDHLESALHHCREAVRLQPNFAEGHNNLGNVLRELGQLTEARACYAETLRLNPDMPQALGNMGQVLQEDGELAEAVIWYRQALDMEPNSARLHCFLASAYEEQENYNEAVARYETVLQLDPDYAEAHNGLGWVRHELGDFEKAMNCYRAALRLMPDFPAAECNLGTLQLELGEFQAAEATFRSLLKRRPTHAGAYAQLATMLRERLPDADGQTMRDLLAQEDLGESRRMSLHFGLAQVCDGHGDFEQAAEHLRQANALSAGLREKSGMVYKPEDHTRFVDRLISAFGPELFARLAGGGADSERPVFIVGLPRSGTTLTEQILASHSRVHGAGELRLTREDFVALGGEDGSDFAPFDALRWLNRDGVRQLADRHLEKLRALNGTADRIVDKMPDNYLYLGLLAVLFPKARFIHCRRDLRDVAVSCWMTNFRQIRWANDCEHIAVRFHEYQRLTNHWRHALPVPILEVEYEDLVADLEGTARRLVAWCGLDWEPRCLSFHEGKRPVRTASVTQVRQPVYTRSLARWKHYEKPLALLFARLNEMTTGVDQQNNHA